MTGRMPVLFVGHGSPMNAIEDNPYSRAWGELGEKLPRPKAILSISAHWYAKKTRANDSEHPKTVYDMYGFPEALYQVTYCVPGAPELARRTKALVSAEVVIDNSWGIDHGTWSVLCRMYPGKDIPVYQLSVDSSAPPEAHYKIGQEISALRDSGVLILGSGNIVHNLAKINWRMSGGYPWAVAFDGYVKDQILKRSDESVIHYQAAGASAELAFVTPEHFYPLLYVLGASGPDDQVSVFNDACTLGSISMTSYLFQSQA